MANNNKQTQKDITAGGNVTQNNISLYGSQPQLAKSLIFDFLKIFINSSSPKSEMNILNLPAPLNQKLIFNNASRYIQIFKNHAHDSSIIDYVITNDLTDGQKAIDRLKDMFYMYVDIDENGDSLPTNGEEIISQLKDDLYDIITKDIRFISSETDDETIFNFAYAFLSYGVSKCQILLNPCMED